MKAVGSFETSGTVYPLAQRHIPEDQKLCHFENLITRKNKECITKVEKDQEDIKHRIQEVRYTEPQCSTLKNLFLFVKSSL